MGEYGFTYDPATNPRTILELIYTEGKDSPVYFRDNGKWKEAEENSPILDFPVFLVLPDAGDEPVDFWDEYSVKADIITETDVSKFIV